MKARLTLLLFVVALLVTGNGFRLSAQDAKGMESNDFHLLVGTWKLNVAKSKFARNDPAPLKEYMIVFSEIGDQLAGTETGTNKDGSAIVYKYLTH